VTRRYSDVPHWEGSDQYGSSNGMETFIKSPHDSDRGQGLQHVRSANTVPVLLLPRPQRVSNDDIRDTSPTSASDRHLGSHRPREEDAPQENLSRRLSELKEKVAWLSQEMTKLGEKSEDAERR
jgi:hypothetical protein